MKKVFALCIAVAMISFMACGGGKDKAKEKAKADSIKAADSIAKETAKADSIAAIEKAKADSIAADTVKKDKKEKKEEKKK